MESWQAGKKHRSLSLSLSLNLSSICSLQCGFIGEGWAEKDLVIGHMWEEADSSALLCAVQRGELDEKSPAAHKKKQNGKLPSNKGKDLSPQYQQRKSSHVAKQKQCEKEFLAHKQQVMINLSSNACDHSPKGGVDHKCLPLMHLLNTHDDYVTTSSCSGRIALFHSVIIPEDRGAVGPPASLKRGGKDALGWLVVKHDVLTEREIDLLVSCLCDDVKDGVVTETATTPLEGATSNKKDGEEKEQQKEGELDGVWVREGVLQASSPPVFGMVALKMEPFVMHVECRTMESAKRLLSAAATDAGFRNSGVTPPGKKIMCGIRHASGLGLDVPLIIDGVNYVKGQHAYLRRLLHMANAKMHGNDVRLHRLEDGVAARLAAEEGAKKRLMVK
ncbi:hypothetical protein TCDM_03830 [Trypanosoma cruzi Dm28c]|uniref:tRNA(Phe) 7-[(3-amino-3-carboxypropyl)-4-demethylwyosine(37)-N(4)]-methyltransferase n=1 Tax=Trypanosoma cruzi Dm28c TaxID=1416333 RepID=V5DJH9_TRYCR|nr:hypothetical protein TCDM_03830 [Trypanosoma cruzi Dm28c]